MKFKVNETFHHCKIFQLLMVNLLKTQITLILCRLVCLVANCPGEYNEEEDNRNSFSSLELTSAECMI